MTKPLPRSSPWITACLVALMAFTLGGSSQAPASPSILPPGAIAPTDAQRVTARKICQLLEEAHYSHAAIDRRMSELVFQRYLEALDPQRSYLLASDINEFSAYRDQFDEMIRTGAIDPAYLMFARFQQRNRERLQYALSQLKSEPDWTVNESFDFERKDAPWPADEAQINELWRKRVKNDALTLLLTGKQWSEATDILRKRYERVLKRIDQVTPEDVFENLMNAYARSFDPHSSYFSPRSAEEYKIQMSLNYDGIGASLQVVDDYVTVMNIIEGGPAAVAATLKTNDRITAVGQGHDGTLTDVIGWRLDDVVQLIRGKAGTSVRLEVLPGGAAPGTPEKTLEFTRNKITLEAQAAHKDVKTVARNGRTYRIGVITVPGFYLDTDAQNRGDENYRSTTRDVAKLLHQLKGENIDGLVLDLRGDGGGFLPEATALTGLFIDHGPVVQLRDTVGHLEVLSDPESGPLYDGPLTVLVDRMSASASEIFAGAIQDYHRGLIIGQTTFGKGTVQSPMMLERSREPTKGQLTVTIGKFYRVTGESTQHRGVEPDIPLASVLDTKEIGESALESSLPWDRIAGVPFKTSAVLSNEPTVATLTAAEDVRAQRDPDYHWLMSDIAAIDTLREQHSVSLNLKVRREERAREDHERLERENSRRAARNLPQLKTVEELDKVREDEPDVMLDQAAQIMTDIVTGIRPGPAQKTARAG
ncbi:MAG TPA: carboxy terminal-processing peptidase [Steroidobacteraceae bacterium]|jgi:carboxyl-terminal processing protease|nr:carboxy terminal-processing peptidase [Steroidobacteraceae bacterium]